VKREGRQRLGVRLWRAKIRWQLVGEDGSSGRSSGSGEGGEDGAREEEVGGGAGGQVRPAAVQRIAGPRDEGVAAVSRDFDEGWRLPVVVI
jgi:hypothetical protein